MRRFVPWLLVALGAGSVGLGCGGDDSSPAAPGAPVHEVYFVGQVYDGATGTRLTGYQLNVRYRDQTLSAEVGPDGRFVVRKMPAFQDYTVEILADNYRAFRSHNSMVLPPAARGDRDYDTAQTLYYDAYLFPSNLVSPAITMNVRKGTSTGDPAAGKMRVRPTSASSLADTPQEIPAGVGVQLWSNDEDLQAKPIARDFTDGRITLAAGELVYGVRYLLSIYEVAGYQPFEGTVTAGVDGTKTLVLQDESADPIALVNQTASLCKPPTAPTETQAASVSFEFNQNIELSTSSYPGGHAEQIDDQLLISSTNTNADLNVNTLANDLSSSVQERGTVLTVNGKTLTVAWNANQGLATKDPGDTITLVRWNLSGIQIQPVGKPGQKVTLLSLYPQASTITCN